MLHLATYSCQRTCASFGCAAKLLKKRSIKTTQKTAHTCKGGDAQRNMAGKEDTENSLKKAADTCPEYLPTAQRCFVEWKFSNPSLGSCSSHILAEHICLKQLNSCSLR